jgi:predicted NBD/HSP70 family sugar kinase
MIDLSGSLRFEVERAHTLAAKPEVTLSWLLREFAEMSSLPEAGGGPLRGVGVGLPGPVEFPAGRVVSPSRMAGWHAVGVRDWLTARLPVPVVVDNDASLMALGEHIHARPELDDLLLVKLGTGIGCGIISNGRLHRGASGAAGDISHVTVSGAGDNLCGCGRRGCLETVASGAAIAGAFEERGIHIGHPSDIVRLVRDGDANATELVRAAGGMVGEVLSVVVNFFNPQAVILGGALAAADPLVASLRATLYERCLPLTTQDLEITTARTGVNAGIIGAGLQALQSSVPIAPQPAD